MSVQSKLTAIADKLRQFFGTEDRYTLDGMAERLGDEIADLEYANEWMAAEFERLKAEYGEDAVEFHPFEYVAQLIDSAAEYVVGREEIFLAYYAMAEVIVNKILALNGSITPVAGTERDTVASEMDKVITEMQNAYTAISEKGGTVPTTQTMGGLDDAVRSIPSGVEVKTASGTLTTNSSGTATVNCGFRPDLVVINGFTYTYGSDRYEYQLSFCFPAKVNGSNYVNAAEAYSTTYSNGISAEFTQATNGFSVLLERYTGSTYASITNTNFNYTAIKYTV